MQICAGGDLSLGHPLAMQYPCVAALAIEFFYSLNTAACGSIGKT